MARLAGMPRWKQAAVLIAGGAWLLAVLYLTFLVVLLFGRAVIEGVSVSAGVLVLGYLALCLLDIQWEWVFPRIVWVGVMFVPMLGFAGAMTTFILRGQTMLAAVAGILFGAVASYVMREIVEDFFGLVNAIADLVVRVVSALGRRLVAAVTTWWEARHGR